MPFFKKVDTKSRKAMVDFLAGHFRYNTMNSWNNATSYAHCLKVYCLPLSGEEKDRLYALMECEEAWTHINDLIADWNSERNYAWQAYFNGRSGGYLVFCEGGVETSRCAKPGGTAAVSRRVYARPGCGVDMGEAEDGYSSWSVGDLRDRVRLVQEFDKLADDIVAEALRLASDYEVVEEQYAVLKKRKALKEMSA